MSLKRFAALFLALAMALSLAPHALAIINPDGVFHSHTFGEWVITREATEESYGLMTQTCTGCNYQQNKRYYLPETITPGTSDRKDEVLALQQELIDLGYFLGRPNGIYDQRTENSVHRFQEDAGESATGIAYPATQDRINWKWQDALGIEEGTQEVDRNGIKVPVRTRYTDWVSNGDGTHSRLKFMWDKRQHTFKETEDCVFPAGRKNAVCIKCGYAPAAQPTLTLESAELFYTAHMGYYADENDTSNAFVSFRFLEDGEWTEPAADVSFHTELFDAASGALIAAKDGHDGSCNVDFTIVPPGSYYAVVTASAPGMEAQSATTNTLTVDLSRFDFSGAVLTYYPDGYLEEGETVGNMTCEFACAWLDGMNEWQQEHGISYGDPFLKYSFVLYRDGETVAAGSDAPLPGVLGQYTLWVNDPGEYYATVTVTDGRTEKTLTTNTVSVGEKTASRPYKPEPPVDDPAAPNASVELSFRKDDLELNNVRVGDAIPVWATVTNTGDVPLAFLEFSGIDTYDDMSFGLGLAVGQSETVLGWHEVTAEDLEESHWIDSETGEVLPERMDTSNLWLTGSVTYVYFGLDSRNEPQAILASDSDVLVAHLTDARRMIDDIVLDCQYEDRAYMVGETVFLSWSVTNVGPDTLYKVQGDYNNGLVPSLPDTLSPGESYAWTNEVTLTQEDYEDGFGTYVDGLTNPDDGRSFSMIDGNCITYYNPDRPEGDNEAFADYFVVVEIVPGAGAKGASPVAVKLNAVIDPQDVKEAYQAGDQITFLVSAVNTGSEELHYLDFFLNDANQFNQQFGLYGLAPGAQCPETPLSFPYTVKDWGDGFDHVTLRVTADSHWTTDGSGVIAGTEAADAVTFDLPIDAPLDITSAPKNGSPGNVFDEHVEVSIQVTPEDDGQGYAEGSGVSIYISIKNLATDGKGALSPVSAAINDVFVLSLPANGKLEAGKSIFSNTGHIVTDSGDGFDHIAIAVSAGTYVKAFPISLKIREKKAEITPQLKVQNSQEKSAYSEGETLNLLALAKNTGDVALHDVGMLFNNQAVKSSVASSLNPGSATEYIPFEHTVHDSGDGFDHIELEAYAMYDSNGSSSKMIMEKTTLDLPLISSVYDISNAGLALTAQVQADQAKPYYEEGETVDIQVFVANTGSIPLYRVAVYLNGATTGWWPSFPAKETREYKAPQTTVTVHDSGDGFCHLQFGAAGIPSADYNQTPVQDIPSDMPWVHAENVTLYLPVNKPDAPAPDHAAVSPDLQSLELTVAQTSPVKSMYAPGEQLTFSATVKNLSDIPLDNVLLNYFSASSSLESGRSLGALLPGEISSPQAYQYTVSPNDASLQSFQLNWEAWADLPDGLTANAHDGAPESAWPTYILSNRVTKDFGADQPAPVADPAAGPVQPADDPVQPEAEKHPVLKLVAAKLTAEPLHFDGMGLTPEVKYMLTVSNVGDAPCQVNAIEITLPNGAASESVGNQQLDPGGYINVPVSQIFADTDVDAMDGMLHISFVAVGYTPSEKVESSPEKLAHAVTDEADTWPIPDETRVSLRKEVTSQPADTAGYHLGETITYKLTVSNDSGETIPAVVIRDALIGPGDLDVLTNLQPYETRKVEGNYYYTVTQDDVDNGQVYNIAWAYWTDPASGNEKQEPSNPVTVMTAEDETYKDHSDDPYGVQVSITFMSPPANGSYYEENESFPVTVSWQNLTGETLYHVNVTDDMAIWMNATADGYLVQDGILLPYASDSFTFPYMVDHYDVDYGWVSDMAFIFAEDAEGNVYSDSDACSDYAGGQKTASLFVVKEEISVPANAPYYLENEKISYKITYVNDGKITLKNIKLFDCLDGSVVYSGFPVCAALAPGESSVYYYDYTVTGPNAQAGQVENYALALYSTDILTDAPVVSAPIVSLTGPKGDPLPPVAVIGPGDSCVLTLTGLGLGAEEYTLDPCDRHAEILRRAENSILAASSNPSTAYNAWNSFKLAWREALDELYQGLLDASLTGEARMAVMADRAALFAYAEAWEKLLAAQQPDRPDLAVKSAADILMRQTAALCYLSHYAGEKRPDSRLNSAAQALAAAAPAACENAAVPGEEGAYVISLRLCADHSQKESVIEKRLAEANDPQQQAQAFVKTQRLYQGMLDVDTSARYRAASAEMRPLIAQSRIQLDTLMSARKTLLSILYPDQPETVAEVLSQDWRDALTRFCQCLPKIGK